MKVIIDRFEGEYAVVELPDRKIVNLPKVLIPDGAQEGEVLKIEIDKKSTPQKKKEIEDLANEVWEK